MLIKVNGRLRYFGNISGFSKVSKSEYRVIRCRIEYSIFGGRAAGGSSSDWFVTTSDWSKPIDCTSLVDSLHLIDTM